MNKLKALLIGAYLLSIVAGVVALEVFGVVALPGGLMAPAAVFVVGVTLVLRDLVHEAAGRRAALLAVVAGAALSAVVSWQFALASGLAFLISETLDLLVYERVRDRFSSIPLGMTASNAVSIPVDSVIFLTLAFGSLDFFWGQVVGKGIATAIAIAVLVTIGTVAATRRDRKLAEIAVAEAEAEEERRAGMTSSERHFEDILRRHTGNPMAKYPVA